MEKKRQKISRSKIDLFIQCSRCFYLDKVLNVKRPSMPAFTLNNAVDHLLKKEFDIYRADQKPHPLMEQHKIDAIPFQHKELDKWRHNFTGIQYLHPETNILIFGAIDDVWINKNEELHIVDYKATSKKEAPNLDGYWQQAYKRQMEIYQWLFKNNGFKVSDTGYFVYVNGRKDEKDFDAKLKFDVDLIPYKGNGDWIDETLHEIADCFKLKELPEATENCEHCAYRQNSAMAIKNLYVGVKEKSKVDDKIKKKKETKEDDQNNKLKDQKLF